MVSSGKIREVAVEGPEGVGKSTLVREYSRRHPEVRTVFCVPEVYLVDLCLLTDVSFRSSPAGQMLINISNIAADYRKQESESLAGPILTDRSIWSAVAGCYDKAPGSLRALLDAVEALRADHVVLPDRVVVLKGSYETCQARIGSRVLNAEADADLRRAFKRRNELYGALKSCGYDVQFISTDGKSPEEVLSEFEALSIRESTVA